jgi:IPT/TIG domain
MRTISILLLATMTAFGLGCGYGSKTITPPTAGTAPTISSLAPTSANHGDPAFVLTVNGTNFASNAAIDWDGTAQTTTFVTGSQLTATIPAAAIASAATVHITVTNPAVAGGPYGGGTTAATSASMDFTVN